MTGHGLHFLEPKHFTLHVLPTEMGRLLEAVRDANVLTPTAVCSQAEQEQGTVYF